jgi:hypothetical protein
MFCTSCGAPNADGAKFCTSCGQQMNTQSSVSSQPAGGNQPELSSEGQTGQRPDIPNYSQPAMPSPLNYKLFGSNLPAVSIRLNSGESIYTQSGGMTWMDQGIQMETNMKGGLMKGLGRMFSGGITVYRNIYCLAK